MNIHQLLFLNLGGGEMALVIFFIIVFFGANKVPELARGLGKGIREFKDAVNGVQREINSEINKIELDKDIKNIEETIKDVEKK